MKFIFFLVRLPFAIIGMAVFTLFLPFFVVFGLLSILFWLLIVPPLWAISLIFKLLEAAFTNKAEILAPYFWKGFESWSKETRGSLEATLGLFHVPYRLLARWAIHGTKDD